MTTSEIVLNDAVATNTENTLASLIVKKAISHYGREEAFKMGEKFLGVSSFDKELLIDLINIYNVNFTINDYSGNGLIGNSPLEFDILIN